MRGKKCKNCEAKKAKGRVAPLYERLAHLAPIGLLLQRMILEVYTSCRDANAAT